MNYSKTILVVDDDQDLRAGLRTVLQKRGFRALEAGDGKEAVDLIHDQRPDLVILDMMMPHWGGFVVLEQFSGQKNAPPFIMITANEVESHKAYAEKMGVKEYLRKPFPMERLLAGVDNILGSGAAPSAATTTAGQRILRIQCGGCGARIKATLKYLGQTHPCPRCQTPFTVQWETPEDEGPMLVLEP